MATFIYPTVKRVTSEFRSNSRPDHHGTDFAQPGYHEIKAVANGKVTRSYESDSYGQCVMIEHKINGDTWESVYAHMRDGSRKVSVGDKVKQGQVIGVMGNTGHSFGQHLHFELHKGNWNINKTHAVDPEKYLGKNLYSPNLKVDGKWGTKTTRALQKALGTVEDGIISDQLKNDVTKMIVSGITFSQGGSLVIRTLQRKIGATVDGYLGPETVSELQKYLGTPIDGVISDPSLVVKELQRRLNKGNF
ncbi:M23 family metallopeptidase [Piscibacillus salipiscarius]|uniref:M23 family metallopeptidase n=1 Tax=Piscibacillus salipiscarius TaxID=299480 RepID=A0ABW5Q714_9BACI|nr:peptidoglycan DD-metalloendopeptidase family protein [Piscibacillus salipiscarius]